MREYLGGILSEPSFIGALLGAMISGMFATILFMMGRYFDNKKSRKIMLEKQEKHKSLINGYLKMLAREFSDLNVAANEIKDCFRKDDKYFEARVITIAKGDIDKSYEHINKILEINSDYKSEEVINLSMDVFIKLEGINNLFKVCFDFKNDSSEDYIEILTSLEDEADSLSQEIKLFLDNQK